MTNGPVSPLDRMITRTVKCVRCGAGYGMCGCWEPITLRCPQCQRTMQTTRDDTDPAGTAVVECVCDHCDDGGGFPEVHYYDDEGRWFDGEHFRSRDGEHVRDQEG